VRRGSLGGELELFVGNSRITPDLRCGVSLKLAVPRRVVARLNLFLLNWGPFKHSPSLEIKKGTEWGTRLRGSGVLLSFLVDVNLLPSLGAVSRTDTVDSSAFNGTPPAWILLERRAVCPRLRHARTFSSQRFPLWGAEKTFPSLALFGNERRERLSRYRNWTRGRRGLKFCPIPIPTNVR
jgi:hypothetical protein